MLRIKTIPVTLFSQNARVLWDPASKEAVLVDPGGESKRLLEVVKAEGLKVSQIWLTHSHIDHLGAVARVKAATGAELFGHRIETEMRRAVPQICRMFGVPEGEFEVCPEPEHYLQGGEVLSLGAERFQVYFTPGHSPGHVAFYHEPSGQLLSGDVLFSGSIGRTDLPGGNHETLLRSIDMLMKALPPKTAVLSGHGPDTTLAEEQKSNPFLQ